MRLDHLLSKEHLQPPCPVYAGVEGLSGVTPVAQTIVLRRVLTGGISADSGRRFFLLAQYGSPLGGFLERWGVSGCGLVFGTLLGPETTGPRPAGRAGLPLGSGRGAGCGFCVFLVSWLHRACADCPLGLVCGVCGTGLLFENYIVDASIFYKKQFPRI